MEYHFLCITCQRTGRIRKGSKWQNVFFFFFGVITFLVCWFCFTKQQQMLLILSSDCMVMIPSFSGWYNITSFYSWPIAIFHSCILDKSRIYEVVHGYLAFCQHCLILGWKSWFFPGWLKGSAGLLCFHFMKQ